MVEYRWHGSNTINEADKDITKNEILLIKKMIANSYGELLARIGIQTTEIENSVIDQISRYPISDERVKPFLIRFFQKLRREFGLKA